MNKLKNIFANSPLKDYSIYGFGQAFNLITPILVLPYIITICGIENYGKISVCLAISFFLLVFIDYGSEIISVREVAIHRENKEKIAQIFSITQGAKLLMLLVIFVVCLMVYTTVPYFKTDYTLYFFSLTILIGQVLNPVWFLQGLEKYTAITFVNIVSKLIYLALVFGFVNTKADFVYVNLFWGLGMIISNTAMIIYLHRIYNFQFSKQQFIESKMYLQQNFKIFLSQVSTSLQLYLPVILIGGLGSNALAGQFKIVEQIITIFRTYLLLFFNFIYPKICFKLQEGLKITIKFWAIANGANLIFILLSMALIFVFRVEIIQHFSIKDSRYLSGLLIVSLLIPIHQAIQIPLKQLVLSFEYTRFYVIISFVQTLLIVISITLSILLFDLLAVIWSIIVSETIITFAYLYVLRRQKEIRQ